jgi:uncharacterized protein YegP (UPF0339 family)
MRARRGIRFVVFEDAAGEWRWHLRAGNGRLVACSGEGFKRKANAVKSARWVRASEPVIVSGDFEGPEIG